MAMETEFGGEGLSYGAWSSEEDVVVFRADRVGVSMGTWGLGCILGINMGAVGDCPALRGVCVCVLESDVTFSGKHILGQHSTH